MTGKTTCLLKQYSREENKTKQVSFLLPKWTDQAMGIGNSSSESQLVSTGLGKSWIIMKMSKNRKEKIILSSSIFYSFMAYIWRGSQWKKYSKHWDSVSKGKNISLYHCIKQQLLLEPPFKEVADEPKEWDSKVSFFPGQCLTFTHCEDPSLQLVWNGRTSLLMWRTGL